MSLITDGIGDVSELSTVVVGSLWGEIEPSNILKKFKCFLPCRWHYGVPSVSIRDHCTVTRPSPVSNLLTIFVSSDRREGMQLEEDGAGFGVGAGTVLCTNRGEVDKQLGRLQLYRKGFAGGCNNYQLTVSQHRHGVPKKKGKVKHPWNI